jgi:hypothetical protein
MTTTHATDPDLILHPVRARIVYAVEGRAMTSGEIAREVPDVPQASLYRQIKKLQQGGVLVVKEERQVHGTVERVYAVDPTAAMVDPKKLAAMGKKSVRYFEIFLSCLRRAYAHYSAQERFDLKADAVTFYNEIAYLTDQEQQALNQEIRELILRARRNSPGGDRRRRCVSYIALPDLTLSTENNPTPSAAQSERSLP